MTGREIYTAAIKKFGSKFTDEEKADLEERAPYLIAAFCTESAELDAAYREAKGLDEAPPADSVHITLNGQFPRSDRFATAAAFYLAAMFVIDEDIELSDKFFDNYCDAMAKIQSEIPTKLEKIAERYI